MKVVEGKFGNDFIPMGMGIKALVDDPFIGDIEEGNFCLVIDTAELGMVVFSNKDEPAEQYFLLSHAQAFIMADVINEMEDDDGA